VHSQLAADKSILVQQAPLPLAELASVFSEMMLLDNLLETDSEEEKRRLIARELDGFYATIMRQAYFTIFERDAHDAFTKAATVSEVSDIYSRNLEEQFGKAVKVTEEFKHEWTYIPHFYHTPFYTYAYSFGNLLTVSLYQMYKKECNKFVGDYVNILSTGGSENPESLLKEAGIDIRSEEGWQGGFDYIKERTRELERLNN
jgi:oligoendopeptidase F